jgi:hypothetical protein
MKGFTRNESPPIIISGRTIVLKGAYKRRGMKPHSTSDSYRRRQEKVSKAKARAAGGRRLTTTTRQEHKYQMIKLVLSGRTLRETKAMMKAVAVAATAEYMTERDKNNLLALEGGINSIAMTRNQANQLAMIRFQPRRKLPVSRAEAVAQFVMGGTVGSKFDWTRDGNLIRRGKPNPSIKGSSKGKIGKTRVIGADRVLKDFRNLIKALRRIERLGDRNARGSALQKASRGFRATVSQTVSKY